jgi:UPF0716 family protein affecting phage T7 exclusion
LLCSRIRDPTPRSRDLARQALARGPQLLLGSLASRLLALPGLLSQLAGVLTVTPVQLFGPLCVRSGFR